MQILQADFHLAEVKGRPESHAMRNHRRLAVQDIQQGLRILDGIEVILHDSNLVRCHLHSQATTAFKPKSQRIKPAQPLH